MLLIEANATDEIDATIMHAHYLPACYLKGFIDPASEVERGKPGEPYVWVRNPATRVWKNRAPHNIAKRPDYYAVTMPDGSKNQAREEALMQLESVVAPILRRIPNDDTLLPDDPATLILFASTMYLRVPTAHAAAEETAILPPLKESLAKSWEGLRADPEELRRSLEAEAEGALAALRRARRDAERLALTTGTYLIQAKDGRPVRVAPRPRGCEDSTAPGRAPTSS